MTERKAEIHRATAETDVRLSLNLDGSGQADNATGVPFLDHMLDQVVRHGGLDLTLAASGDLAVDAHHTVEDVGIALGQGITEAVGEKRGLYRYGHAYCPLDEALSRAVVDLSGRPGLEYHLTFHRDRIGNFDVDLIREFFGGLVNHGAMTIHLDNLRGTNAHHIAESAFKAFGRALRIGLSEDPKAAGAVPSTKGSL